MTYADPNPPNTSAVMPPEQENLPNRARGRTFPTPNTSAVMPPEQVYTPNTSVTRTAGTGPSPSQGPTAGYVDPMRSPLAQELMKRQIGPSPSSGFSAYAPPPTGQTIGSGFSASVPPVGGTTAQPLGYNAQVPQTNSPIFTYSAPGSESSRGTAANWPGTNSFLFGRPNRNLFRKF